MLGSGLKSRNLSSPARLSMSAERHHALHGVRSASPADTRGRAYIDAMPLRERLRGGGGHIQFPHSGSMIAGTEIAIHSLRGRSRWRVLR